MKEEKDFYADWVVKRYRRRDLINKIIIVVSLIGVFAGLAILSLSLAPLIEQVLF